MRTFRFIGAVALVLAALFGVGALAASAQGPVGDSPYTATFIDNASHSIGANSSLWFRFNYSMGDSGERPISTITLVNGNKPGLGFEVWTLEALAGQTENKPVGRGGSHKLDCDTGQFTLGGECVTSDLTWVGAFGLPETY
jgi:hypothetical protein